MTTQLPEFLRGVCLAPLPPEALMPFTALFAALAGAVVLRSAYDLADPLKVGDEREGPRHMLQWTLTASLAVLFWFGLHSQAGAGFVPYARLLGPWLRTSLGAAGGVLALRSLIRMQIRFFRRVEGPSPIVPDLVARPEVDEAAYPMPMLEHAVPDHRLVAGSDLPGLLCGAAMLGVALLGWDMGSTCLWRLPY